MRKGINVLVGLFVTACAFVFLIELFAYATWSLADARRPRSRRVDAPLPERAEVGPHRVEEWPADRSRDLFSQSPTLDALVASGDLPPVQERLPVDPLVIVPPEQPGPYGGIWRRYATNVGDVGVFQARIAYEGLLRWDPMGREILPNLATRWEVADEGRTYTFWLRRGVRWSDGVPFTADDIMFWYEDVFLNEELTPVPFRELRAGDIPVHVEKIDDYAVRFSFAEPKGLFLKQLASGVSYSFVSFPRHYYRQFHPRYTPREDLEAMARREGLTYWYQLWRQRSSFASNPNLPQLWAWMVEVPAPAQPVVFKRNPYYWKVDPDGRQLPYIDRISFDVFDLELINLKAAEGAIGMQARHLDLKNYPLFMRNRGQGDYRLLEWVTSGGSMYNIAFNLNHRDPVLREIFGDARFRKALSLAIDREELDEVGFYGLGAPRQAAPPSTSLYYDPEYEKAYTEHNPSEANRMLDEMGLDRRDDNGRRLMPDGRPIRLFIDMATMSGNAQLMELVAEYWTNVGVHTDVKLLARELFYQRKAALMHDVGMWWSSDEQEPTIDPRWLLPFTGESIQGVDYALWFMTDGKSGTEPHGPVRECIELYKQIERDPDPEAHIRLFRRIIDINRENLWVLGTVGDVPTPVIVHNSFRNVPDKAMFGWVFRTPGNTAPECYAIDTGPAPSARAAAEGGS